MSIEKFVSYKKYYHGYLVTYPALVADEEWDFLTFREKFFESNIGGPRAYDQARRFASEIKKNLGRKQSEDEDDDA